MTGIAWKAGLMFTPTDKLRVGLTYMSEIVLDVEEGDATFSNFPDIAPFPETSNFAAELPLPAELTIGLSYQVTDKFLFAFDFARTFWDSYESLDLIFSDPGVAPSLNPRNYENSSIYRFGLQYEVTDNIVLRGGYYRDESPLQNDFFSPETPRPDADGITGGVSVNLGENFSIDASFLYLTFKEITASYNGYNENGVPAPFGGTYIANAFIPGIGVTYKL